MIKISGYKITHSGDSSAGIGEREWNVLGPFQFDSLQDEMGFRRSLQKTFEVVCTFPEVKSFEQIKFEEIASEGTYFSAGYNAEVWKALTQEPPSMRYLGISPDAIHKICDAMGHYGAEPRHGFCEKCKKEF